MILINPKFNNPFTEYRAVEPPIWCALLAKEGDAIVDNEVEDIPELKGDVLIVVMGNNPSVSSTPKMPEAMRLMRKSPHARITGLHPMAVGQATYPIPPPSELVKTRRARWELLDMSKYRAHNWHCLHDLDSRGHYASLYTSYGCPFDCSFCNIHTIYKGRKVYYRNPQDVIDEIKLLVTKYGVKNLKLCDELFTLNLNHVTAICGGIKKYRLNIWAYARVGTVTPSLLEIMKGAGINWLAYGFESGNPAIRNGISKNYGDIEETVRMTKEAGINIIGNYMFGLPNDTLETMTETLNLAQDLNCEYANFYCAMAYPGSKLYTGRDNNWAGYNQYGDTAVPKWIRDFRDKAFRGYFSNPRYLRMIGGKFGGQAIDHIKSMLG